MILNHLFPIFFLIVLGKVLQKFNITNDDFFKTSDRLIYYVFFPAMLFHKITSGKSVSGIQWEFIISVICAIVSIYGISLLFIKALKIDPFKAGSFSQSTYRFNTYLGMAVIIGFLGDEGAGLFAVMAGFVIPPVNFLAVSTLIWFSEGGVDQESRFVYIVKSLCANPLILSSVAGILYALTLDTVPMVIQKTLSLASSVTLPLALLSIGGSLSMDSLHEHLPLSLTASFLKLVLLPLIGLFFFRLFGVDGLAFKTGMIFFTLPASTAIYVLSSQLAGDTRLASASIGASTFLSFFSLSFILMYLTD